MLGKGRGAKELGWVPEGTEALCILGRPTEITEGSRKSGLSTGTSLAVQRLGLHAPTAGGMGSITGRRTKVPSCPAVLPKLFLIKKKRIVSPCLGNLAQV